ncbi:hypothetical protein [Aggregatilinea lenta]|uniref:hypothetical protein n=1 Tax=Aggregatilinea lenta TaxID=913108 RepID=UPI000E5B12A4|nr:hypothetical protein [Aggregatilinea lenta]
MRQRLNNLFGSRSKPDSISLPWQSVRHQPVYYENKHRVRIGRDVLHSQFLRLEELSETIDVCTLSDALLKYRSDNLLNVIVPQFAAVIYDIIGNLRVMSMYFPIVEHLSAVEGQQFHRSVQELTQNPNFGLRIWNAYGGEITGAAPPSMAYLVAGHIVEIFFYRPDLRERFFSTSRYFDLYMDVTSYHQAGGVAGGCYDPATGSIKLVASRLFEGFYGEAPGVAPFIHEFGHMLDAFDIRTATMGFGTGLLPGMRETDGELFSAEARTLFLQGKRLELERYEKAREERPGEQDIPVGHPYVFTNDGEFIAGYLEMFFRNPHYFYQLNPTLFKGFVVLFNQDPRNYWKEDFDYYIRQNRDVYLLHRRDIGRPGLRSFA